VSLAHPRRARGGACDHGARAAFFWLSILFGLTMTDFLSRGWLPALGK
jgi:hypothetical protein